MSTKPRYRLVSGTDDEAFCQRVSEILDDGYILYGSPAITLTDGQRLVVQALILPQPRPERHGGGDFGGPRRPFRKFDDDRGGGGGGDFRGSGGGGDFRGGGGGDFRGGGGGDFGKDKPFGGRRPGRF